MPNQESEFGTVIKEVYDGQIVRNNEGALVFVSSAYNPLSIRELKDVVAHMRLVKP